MNHLDHLKRYPNARPSTIKILAKRDEINTLLAAEIARKRRKERLKRFMRWPAYVWRW